MLTDFAHSGQAPGIARNILGDEAKPVRMILFDKSPETNWTVPSHQELNIAVSGKIDDPEYGPWSNKENVPHVVPPREILERMVTLRFSIDACSLSQGPLRVLPETHRHGKVAEKDKQGFIDKYTPVDCVVDAGDLVCMHPLLLHSSRKSTGEGRRRVIHIEYSAAVLPDGLEWSFCPRKSELRRMEEAHE